jgi:hypothetical protein
MLREGNTTFLLAALLGVNSVSPAQEPPAAEKSARQPIYEVTVVSRTTKAVNYGHRALPTKIDFKGTVLLPSAEGEAKVESKRGSTVIEAHFSGLESPQRFGPEYLTYVLWAISPAGRPENLGEIFLNTRDKGKLEASSNLQAFALIVTAEPHFSVSRPSDAVVMENAVRPDTIGKIEEVNATYELLPRKQFTYDKDAPVAQSGRSVSREEYDSLAAIYQAQNAIQLAESHGASEYAAERLARARDLFNEAKGYSKSQRKQMIATAREATQVAEDARRIAEQRASAPRISGQQP